jgi:hypothetical protein
MYLFIHVSAYVYEFKYIYIYTDIKIYTSVCYTDLSQPNITSV